MDPRDRDEVIAIVEVDSGAIATSGDYEQFFVDHGVRYSHIFDPRLGTPARGVASATTIAPTAVEADAYSKPLFVLGPSEGCRFADSHPRIEGIWIRDAGE